MKTTAIAVVFTAALLAVSVTEGQAHPPPLLPADRPDVLECGTEAMGLSRGATAHGSWATDFGTPAHPTTQEDESPKVRWLTGEEFVFGERIIPGGTVPEDYINPVQWVRENGHLRHELEVHIQTDPELHKLHQVLSFDAPDWARAMLVEFRPARPWEERGLGGIHLRPHNPFVEMEYPSFAAEPIGTINPFTGEDRYVDGTSRELEYHTIRQEAYRSSGHVTLDWEYELWNGEMRPAQHNVMANQYILVTRDMDPPPAGKSWHVAISSTPEKERIFPNEKDVEGTLRVYFSGSLERTPLAIQIYFNATEQEEQRGFFDPTPRVPDGDNPGTTYGEAYRWLLYKSAETLLEELDFYGMFPIDVAFEIIPQLGALGHAEIHVLDNQKNYSSRLRSEQMLTDSFYGGTYNRNPPPVMEREAGTDLCRAGPMRTGRGGAALQQQPHGRH